MPTLRLSKSTIDALPSTQATQFYWDDTLHGFGLKLLRDGTRTYVVQYRTAGGRAGSTRRVTIGKHGSPWTAETARAEAKLILGRAAVGDDPAKAKRERREMLTVAQLCDQYMRDGTGTKKDSTLATDRGRIDRHIKPSLGQRKVDEVTQADIRKFMKNIAEGTTAADLKTKPRGRAIVRGGKGTATRTVGLLSGIFTYAKELGLIDQNPVHGIKRYPDKKNERYLTPAELAALGQALDQADILGTNPKALTIVRLLIYTGARRGEIERLTWKEVDLVGGRLKLDDSKTGQKVIRLNSTARELLEKWGSKTGHKTGYVFKATEGDGHFVGTPRIWSSLRKACGLHDVRLHDLRHSFASVGVMAGTPLMIVGALLGHADHSTTQRYAHIADDPIALAAEQIGQQLREAMSGTAAGNSYPGQD